MRTLHSRLRDPEVTVVLGEGGRVVVSVPEADGTVGEVDLEEDLADVISLGARSSVEDAGPDGVVLCTVEVVGPVRVWVEGRRVEADAVAQHVGNAVVSAVTEVVRRLDEG